MPAHSVDQVGVFVLPVSIVVGTSTGAMTMPEGDPAAGTVLRSEAVAWTVADYNSKYANCSYLRWFNAIFSDVRNVIMYDLRGVKHETDIGRWNRR